ncbi:unnamed protein product [Lupinus luteus]|uniref:F-box domain-containing protein n=1 Tax=Lupinus luteus TaxID=3873 RepID=A0AAV1XTK0_LUPLU
MEISDFTELILGLPNDLGLGCLTRLPNSSHRVAIRVCHQWQCLFESDKFYNHRKKTGQTRKLACLVQAHDQPKQEGERKPSDSVSPSYNIIVFDPVASSKGKLVLIGGWDPVSYEPMMAVFVYDFCFGRWRKGRDMPEKRSFFAIGLDPMTMERDKCEGVVVGDELWAVSGYGTERQGMFEGSDEVLNFGSG